MTIKKQRELCKLTQQEIANKLGISRTTVTMWENGAAKPRADMLLALSELFKCSIDDLLKK